jgi:hypothetical protein
MSGEITYANILPKTLPKYYYDNKWHTQTEFQEDKDWDMATGYGVYEKRVNLIFSSPNLYKKSKKHQLFWVVFMVYKNVMVMSEMVYLNNGAFSTHFLNEVRKMVKDNVVVREGGLHTYYVGEVKNQKALTGKAIQAIKKPESLANFFTGYRQK